MKKNLLIIIFLSIFFGTSAQANYSNECFELWDYSKAPDDIATEADVSNEHNKMILLVMSYFKKIVDIKFKTTTYLEENKGIYGKYESLKTKKDYLEVELEKLHKERVDILDHYKLEIDNSDPKLSQRNHVKIYKRIMRQRKRDLKTIDKKISSFDRQRKDMLGSFLRALEKWAPYKNYLEQLEKLEFSLEKSVQRLSNIIGEKVPVTINLSSEVSGFQVIEDANDATEIRKCTSLLNKLKEYESHIN